jgi:hypothetical protein
MEHAVLAHLGRSERKALANLLAQLEQALVHQLGDGCDT